MLTDEEKEISSLALLYLSQQDLTNATPESLADKYADAFRTIEYTLSQTPLGRIREATKTSHKN